MIEMFRSLKPYSSCSAIQKHSGDKETNLRRERKREREREQEKTSRERERERDLHRAGENHHEWWYAVVSSNNGWWMQIRSGVGVMVMKEKMVAMEVETILIAK